jgi:N-acetylneuraminic acid mutarotase
MSKGRDHMVAQAFDGKIHVIGGRFGASIDKTGLHEIYDPAADSWTLGPPLPTPRSGGTGTVFRDMIIVVGGEGGEGGKTFNNVEGYDPKADKWVTLAPMPTGRHAFGLAAVGSSIYLVAGARGGGGREVTPDVLAFTLQ